MAPAAKSGVLVALRGRNQLRGIVEERGDGLLAQVTLRTGDQPLTAIITGADAELKPWMVSRPGQPVKDTGAGKRPGDHRGDEDGFAQLECHAP